MHPPTVRQCIHHNSCELPGRLRCIVNISLIFVHYDISATRWICHMSRGAKESSHIALQSPLLRRLFGRMVIKVNITSTNKCHQCRKKIPPTWQLLNLLLTHRDLLKNFKEKSLSIQRFDIYDFPDSIPAHKKALFSQCTEEEY